MSSMRDSAVVWRQASWWRPATRALAVAGPVATCAVLYFFRESIASTTAALVLVLWVVGAAATGDRISGVLAGVSGGLSFDFFLTVPYLNLTISDPDDIETATLLVLISLAVTEVALWGFRQQAQASQRSGYLEGVLGTARTIAAGDASPATVIAMVSGQIVEVLGVSGCRYVDGAIHDVRIATLDHDGTLTRGGKAVDVDHSGLPSDEYVALAVRRGQRVVGHFLLTSVARVAYPTREECRVAVLLADQVGAALADDPPQAAR